jgi:DNA-binding transcriptional LysR family regulator
LTPVRLRGGTDTLFVSNRLTIIVPTDNLANIDSLADLAQPNTQLILAMEGVPIRQYSDQVVATMTADFQEKFYGNLVSEENNVRQVSAKVALGEADAGIVYISDVTLDIADQVQQIAIPDEQNAIAIYPIAPLADAPQLTNRHHQPSRHHFHRNRGAPGILPIRPHRLICFRMNFHFLSPPIVHAGLLIIQIKETVEGST